MEIKWPKLFKKKSPDQKQDKIVVSKQSTSLSLPQQIFIERTDDGYTEYSTDRPAMLDKFYSLLYGFYSNQNFLELFYCLPEVFAPVHEIASRVADCNWQLLKDWNDEQDWSNETFNRLFSKPNALQDHKTLVYWQVVYEIVTGGQFDFFLQPDTLAAEPGEEYKNILRWMNLPAHQLIADIKKNVDPYSMLEISDLVNFWKLPAAVGGYRRFEVTKVIPTLHLSIDKPFDLNVRMSQLLGADKPIKNLIPVYEARGIIYIKRGAMGFMVSNKKDESGTQAFTPKERTELEADAQASYGITGNKTTIGITSQPVDFVRTAMSIEELQPFDETLADAVAIYRVLRVPRHLVPSKDTSTFANAEADMISFYDDVIIPIAKRKAQTWTSYMKFPRRYINADFSHIKVLQQNRKTEAEVAEIVGRVYEQRWLNGVCSLNDWITAIDGDAVTGSAVFEKKLPELTPDELLIVTSYINLKVKPITNADPTSDPKNK